MNSRFFLQRLLAFCVIAGGFLTLSTSPTSADDNGQPLIRLATPRTAIAPPAPARAEVTPEASPANDYATPLPPPTAARNRPARGILAPFFNRRNYGYQQPAATMPEPQPVRSTPAAPPINVPTPRIAQSQPLALPATESVAPQPTAPVATAPVATAPPTSSNNDAPTIQLAQRGAVPTVTPSTIATPATLPAENLATLPADDFEPEVVDEPELVNEPTPMPAAVAEATPPTPTVQPIVVRPAPEPSRAVPDQRVLTIRRGEPTPAATVADLAVYLDSPDKLVHGDNATVKVRIVNRGSVSANDVTLDIVANGQLLKTLNVGVVTAERSVEVEVQLTPQVMGEMELQAVAQPAAGDRVVAVRSMFVGKPELTLAIAGRARIDLGTAQSYTAIITNDGNADAADVTLTVLLQGNQSQSVVVGNVLAGQTRRVAFELQPAQSGALALNAVATGASGVQAAAYGSIQVLQQETTLAVEDAAPMPVPGQ